MSLQDITENAGIELHDGKKLPDRLSGTEHQHSEGWSMANS